MFENTYNINDLVYHRLPDSPRGVVIDWKYIASTGKYEYLVCFDVNVATLWYFEHELSITKNY